MILEHGIDPVSAKWDHNANTWNVGEKIKWRWNTPENKPASEWFYTITDALDWIKQYDEKRLSSLSISPRVEK